MAGVGGRGGETVGFEGLPASSLFSAVVSGGTVGGRRQYRVKENAVAMEPMRDPVERSGRE